jgi:hypothetical protein
MQAAIQREGSTAELIQIERLDAESDAVVGGFYTGQTQLLDLQIRHTSNHSGTQQNGYERYW